MTGEQVGALIGTVVPVSSLIVTAAIVFIALHFRNKTRQLRHAERMAALEKGIELPPEPTLGRNAYLLRGLMWLFVGIGVSAFFWALYLAEKQRELLAPTALGLIPMGVGIAYLIVYRIQGRQAAAAQHSR